MTKSKVLPVEEVEDQEYSHVSKSLDNEIKSCVKEFLKNKSELLARKIRIRHPIFSLLTINAFKYLLENG